MLNRICALAGLLLTLTAFSSTALPLWELEGTQNRVRLLGSIHFLRAEDYPLPAAIQQSFDAADVIVMELDLTRINPVGTVALLQRLAIDPKGRTLAELIGTQSWRTASRQADAIKIDLATMQGYEPWFAALQISQLRLQQLGFDPSYGIESRLSELAVNDGKQIRGLETMEQQLSALDSLPPRAQQVFLLETLDEAAEIGTQLDDIVRAWRAGDSEALEREMMDGMKAQPALYERIIRERNQRWADQITAFSKEPRDFLIIVGALHLVGDDSVLEMMRQRGFGVRQISSP